VVPWSHPACGSELPGNWPVEVTWTDTFFIEVYWYGIITINL
jgi:hypothetical protein